MHTDELCLPHITIQRHISVASAHLQGDRQEHKKYTTIAHNEYLKPPDAAINNLS